MNAMSQNFVLKRAFWNYPALIAFHSKYLTHLVYLSRQDKCMIMPLDEPLLKNDLRAHPQEEIHRRSCEGDERVMDWE